MTINFDRAFGSHDQALIVRAHRGKLLAENIANADTPGYRARDLDFSRLVKAFSAGPALTSTDPRHIGQVHSTSADVAAAGDVAVAGAVVYRTPTQASLDGNTVKNICAKCSPPSQALDDAGGIVAHAAKRLRMGRTTLVEKMRKLGVRRHEDVAESL